MGPRWGCRLAASVPASVSSLVELSTRAKILVLAGMMLGFFTASMDGTIVSTAMPRIIADLVGFGLFSWVGMSFMLANTTALAMVGKLSDLYGRKPFLMAGAAVLLLGSVLAGSS